MEILAELVVGIVFLLVGAVGFIYKSLSSRLARVEHNVSKKPYKEEVRCLISDRLEPYKVELRAISRRIDELYVNQKAIEAKMDRIIELLTNAKK